MNRCFIRIAIFLLVIFAVPAFPAQLEDEGSPAYKGRKIDVVLNDADIRKVLILFGECAGTNMIIKGDVSGSITLNLKSVPWDQVFDILIDLFDLKTEFVNGTLVIGKDL